MAKVRINDKSIRKAAPASGRIELTDDLVKGFHARIQASGQRSYLVYARAGGEQLRYVFAKAPGPELPAGVPLPKDYMTPADARAEARRLFGEGAG